MADYWYGGSTSDYTFEIVGDQQVMRGQADVIFWDSEISGSRIEGLKDAAGELIDGDTVVSDDNARLPRFKAPVPSMWADAGLGRFLIQSTDLADLIAAAIGPAGGEVTNLDVSGELTASALQADDGEITDLVAQHVSVADGGTITIGGEDVLVESDLAGIIGGGNGGGSGGGSSDATVLRNKLNTTAMTYLRREQLTTSLTQMVIWEGQSSPPRHSSAGGSDINGARPGDKWLWNYALPLLGTSTIPAAPSPTEPVTPTPDNITLHAPSYLQQGSTGVYQLSALLDVTVNKTFAYLQIALRKVGGGAPGDVALSPNTVVLGPGSKTLTGLTTTLANGDYDAYISYNLTGGTSQASWVDGPKTRFTVNVTQTTPTPGTTVTWNSGKFTAHSAAVAGSWNTSFAPRGNNTNIAVFPTRTDAGSLTNYWYLSSSTIPVGYTGAISVGVPMCYTGGSLSQDLTAPLTAMANTFNTDGRVFYIRLGWEMNLNWPWKVTDANLTQWRSRWTQYYNIFKTIMGSKAQIGFNPNGGVDQSGITGGVMRAYVDGKVDWLGPDQYDCYPPFTNDGNVSSHLTGTGGLNFWANTAINKGVKLALPEWGVSHDNGSNQWTGNVGNDNTRYITEMCNWMKANSTRMLFDSYFNEPDDYIQSDIYVSGSSSAGSHNPNAGTLYKSLFTA